MKLYLREKGSVMDKISEQRIVFSFDSKHQKVSFQPDIFHCRITRIKQEKKRAEQVAITFPNLVTYHEYT